MGQPNRIRRSFPTFIRLLRRGLQVVVIILIVLVIVHTTLNVVLHRRVAAKLAEIREAGGALTLSELVPDLAGSEQNATVYYEYAHTLSRRVIAEEEWQLDAVITAFEIRPSRSMTSRRESRGAERGVQKARSFRDMIQSMRVDGEEPGILPVPGLELTPSKPPDDDPAVQAAREYLEKVQPGVEADGREIELAARHVFKKMEPGFQVVKDARALKHARMLSDYSLDVDAISRLILPCLARTRSLARYVARAAVLAARDGDTDEAFDLISAGLHLANSLRDEPILIVQLVRIAIAGVATDAVYEILDEGYPTDEHVHMIIAELDQLRDRNHFARALQGERCFAISYERIYPAPFFRARYLLRPVRLADELVYLDLMGEVIEAAALPTYKSGEFLKELTQRFPAEYPPVEVQVHVKPFTSVFRSAPPARVFQGQDRLVAQCDLAEAAIYLKQYKKKTGSYPAKLEQIMPEFTQELPVDPFVGRPYIYRKDGDGFVLYSVALNEVDDGGIPDWTGGDIVWRSSR